MIEYKNLIFELKNKIGILKINSPQTLNALSRDMLQEIYSFLGDQLNNKSLGILIITGEGKAFIAGADIKEMNNMDPLAARNFSILGNHIMRVIETFPVPVIAAVNGYALGGGLELVLSADFAYASKNAKLGFPELSLGLIPGFGGCKRLSDRIGMALAKELIFSGRIIAADEAMKLKLVNKVTEPEELLPEVLKAAESIMALSPNGLRESKALLNQCNDLSMDEITKIEVNKFGLLFAHPDSRIGMTSFIEKTKPVWKENL
jgi:enoyl-CoA hydratase